MGVTQNDCKGVSFFSNDAGTIMFIRPEVTATGSPAAGTTDVSGWSTDPDLASQTGTVAEGNGTIT